LNPVRDQLGMMREMVAVLRPHLRGSRLLVLAVIAGSLLMTLSEGIGVGLLVPLLSLLLGGEQAIPMRPIQWMEQMVPGRSAGVYVALFCAAVVGAVVAKSVASYAVQRLAASLKRRVSVNLRTALFRRLHGADLDVFDTTPGGELSNVFLQETARAAGTLDALIGLVQRLSMIAVYTGGLLLLSWPLTLLTATLGISLGASIAFVHRRLTRAGADLTAFNMQLASDLAQSFAGVRVIRAAGRSAAGIEAFERVNVAQARAEERGTSALALLHPVTESLAVAGAMAIVIAGYVFFVRPGHMLSSHLLGFGFVLLRLLPALNQLYSMQGHLLYLAAGAREVGRWLDVRQYPPQPFGTRAFRQVRHGIRFERVSFTYSNGTAALADVSFELPAGRSVALAGPSGAGKSTLAALLLRLRLPTGGRIAVDGQDYREFSADTWHQAVALVEQEAFLFSGTLAANIAFGLEDVAVERLHAAVRAANLTDVIAALPQGLDTMVGERGAMLSGGERQRVAIARALVRNPQILILDEATSQLDPRSDQLVQDALANASRGRTTLVIAHRLSTIRQADYIVVLEDGRVAEQGTWTELESRSGLFAQLFQGGSLV
jgi:ATP-binding cassette, subfamily B, bacterial MsbA